jgi:cation transport ATPase
MENDFLKSAWRRKATEDKNTQDLEKIIRDRGHRVVKKVRRQLIIEVIATVSFLIVYYDFFDGDKKPFLANTFLVMALVFMAGQNIVAFIQFRSEIKGENIGELLNDRVYKMKMYVIGSSILRLLVASSFLVFFVSVIKFTVVKYLILAGAILFFLIQLGVFIRTWSKRIGHMKEAITDLHKER